MKNRLLFYWRVFVLAALAVLFAANIISLNTFFAMIAGIIVFVGVPEAIKVVKNKDKED